MKRTREIATNFRSSEAFLAAVQQARENPSAIAQVPDHNGGMHTIITDPDITEASRAMYTADEIMIKGDVLHTYHESYPESLRVSAG